MSVIHCVKSAGIIRIFFSIFFNIKVCCVSSLESPHRCDSNDNTQYTIFKKKRRKNRKTPQIIPNLQQLWDFFQGTQERVRNSRGKRAISVRATVDLLYNILSRIFCLIQIALSHKDIGYTYVQLFLFESEDLRSTHIRLRDKEVIVLKRCTKNSDAVSLCQSYWLIISLSFYENTATN